MRKFLLACAFGSTVVASAPLSFEMDAGVGYRQDAMKYNVVRNDVNFPFEAYRVKIDPLRGVAAFGFAQANLRNFIVRGEGDYTWICSGKTDLLLSLPANEGATSDQTFPAFQTAKNRGRIFDILGSGGYRIVCYDSPSTAFSITPRGGYGIHHYRIKMRDVSPQPATVDLTGSSFPPGLIIMIALDPGTVHVKWYGPFAAGDVVLRFCEKFRLSATYAYHWLDMRFRQTPSFDLSFNGIPIVNVSKFIKVKSGRAWSQEVQGRFSYLIDSHWIVGLFGQTQLFKMKQTKTIIPGRNIAPSGAETRDTERDLFKIRSQMFLVGVEASYTF